MRAARLRGPDHTQIGAIDGIALGAGALAISRGGAVKTYSHAEPNEDSAILALGAGGTLLAVADGHHGAHGADAATAHLAESVAARWCAEPSPFAATAELADAAYQEIRRAGLAVAEDAAARRLGVAPTTLSLALVRPAEQLIVHATVGDSHVFRVDAEGATDLGLPQLDDGGRRAHFLGPPEETWHRANTSCGSAPIAGARALVLVTDGLSEEGIGVADPAAAVAAACEAALEIEAERRAQWLARRIVQTALDAQVAQRSGDNIAVAVLWLAAEGGNA